MPFAVLFPGQGAQFRGMGADVFAHYPALTEFACDLLGYDLVAVCRDDPDGILARTECTQPALFVVNALHTFERERREERRPDYYLGHSLGEYNALLAAGVFDFQTGLRLVRKRGELMAAVSDGGMTAVLGVPERELLDLFRQDGIESIDVAGFNSDTQLVIAGPYAELRVAHEAFTRQGVRFVPLRVGGPFHSRYMEPARVEFEKYLRQFTFHDPHTPVIANVTGLPHVRGEFARTLGEHLVEPVRWADSIRRLPRRDSPLECEEVGGRSLLDMVRRISASRTPAPKATTGGEPGREPGQHP
ncbi:acyltransferase domain-containing protein [Streptomyces sp. MUM 203J]|uniref:acyltransferase domain-containing protein n=1 Tax=Streptomyces sp. MUM 203J TaxID=2791990 RepID=UPI001F05027F|nr:acyltransferase domain-containing protein [Streptomyces sp. MUM 203J]MCH0540331.1 acyltransferase domain-containing protein [Streptomyces sp. MUM 203J]